jgi:hypothetical protein
VPLGFDWVDKLAGVIGHEAVLTRQLEDHPGHLEVLVDHSRLEPATGHRVPVLDQINPGDLSHRQIDLSPQRPSERLQQLVWSLESLCRIFLKQFLKETDDRLWNILESLRR